MRPLICLALFVALAPSAGAATCSRHPDGLHLADGICATVFAQEVGPARHLAVRRNGDVYVLLSAPRHGGAVVVLHDDDGDGRADRSARFGAAGGTGIAIRGTALYVGTDRRVLRYRLVPDRMTPATGPEVIATGFPRQTQHAAKSLALDGHGHLYANVGAPSNACQRRDRRPGSPGHDPCPQRARHAGIWRFSTGRTDQAQADAVHFARGIRNAVALAWDRDDGSLWAVQQGRDQLHQLWPHLYDARQGAELPAEELLRVHRDDDFGWPYCYYDGGLGRRVLAPEYGGDGERAGRCRQFASPAMAFPAHWAPDDLLFYRGTSLGPRYRGGAFIAFHGSWNRAPLPQQGYKVVFVPFRDGGPAGQWQVFADGFAGPGGIASPGDARYRPVGLAESPDGALYVADSVRGRIWRFTSVPR
ncbi:MAG TPA: PQQ-dependent sugar dehydrogenase [Gammaproteobacteria bacterium]|nr:PQQ-dependent sugar dehydrogenase [Gammaproteobacteria bacterium]